MSIEGIDGSGKTTQVELLVAALSSYGLKVLKTKEPSGGWIGPAVRSILVAERPRPLSVLEEMLLVSAARFDHIRSIIRPALAAGGWVVTDRFVDSTFAFQVFGTGLSEQVFDTVTAEVVGKTMPDLTFILDIDPDIAVGRRAARMGTKIEDPAELTRNFSRVRNGLLEAARRAPQRCQLIDAAATPEIVAKQIISIVDSRLGLPSDH